MRGCVPSDADAAFEAIAVEVGPEHATGGTPPDACARRACIASSRLMTSDVLSASSPP